MVGSELKNVLAKNDITTKSLAISLELGIGSVIKIPYSKKLYLNHKDFIKFKEHGLNVQSS